MKRGKFDTARALADRLVEQLEKGVSPWHKPWNCGEIGFPRNAQGREYRGMNLFLLGLMGHANPFWLTYRKAAELGGQVRKGERGCPVMYWQRKELVEEDEDGNVTTRSYMLIRGYTVFNAEQVDGLPDRFYPPPPKAQDKRHKPHREAERLWAAYEGAPEVRHGSVQASYSPSEDVIRIPDKRRFDSIEGYYSTLFHEGGHSTGHASRLGRKFGRDFGKEPYAKEELVAEMCAQLLCQRCGITRTLENAAAYCKSWAKHIKSMPDYGKAIVCAAAQAQRAADWIIGVRHEKDGGDK